MSVVQSSPNLFPIVLPASVFPSFSLKKKHSSGTTEHIPFFQLFWLRAICFNDELILRVHSTALPAWAVMPFAHVRSEPRSNLSLITAGEAKSRNGTSPCSAELHFYHWVPLSLIRFFSLSQLLRCLSLIFLSFLSYSFPSPSPLNRNILYSLPHSPPPHLFLDLCSSFSAGLFLPPSIRSRRSSGGNSPSAAGSEFRASFIEFAQDSGRVCLPIRSWWGASRLWANPQIHLTPACVSKCVYLSLECCQSVSKNFWGFILNV